MMPNYSLTQAVAPQMLTAGHTIGSQLPSSHSHVTVSTRHMSVVPAAIDRGLSSTDGAGAGGGGAGAGRGGIDYLVYFALVGPGVNNSFKTCHLPLRFPVSVERRVAGRKPSLTLWKTGSIDYPLLPFP